MSCKAVIAVLLIAELLNAVNAECLDEAIQDSGAPEGSQGFGSARRCEGLWFSTAA
jgi:hypothetical protein